MTLSGKENHYNVKFLKGYGFSIKVKDNKLVFKNTEKIYKQFLKLIYWLEIVIFKYDNYVVSLRRDRSNVVNSLETFFDWYISSPLILRSK